MAKLEAKGYTRKKHATQTNGYLLTNPTQGFVDEYVNDEPWRSELLLKRYKLLRPAIPIASTGTRKVLVLTGKEMVARVGIEPTTRGFSVR